MPYGPPLYSTFFWGITSANMGGGAGQNLVNLFLIKLVRISGSSLSFLSDRSVFSTLWQNVLKILGSLGKERKTQKSSLI